MKQLILVRYGQYEDGHLTDEGVETMIKAGAKIMPLVPDLVVRLVAAETFRAIESAEVIGNMISKSVEVYSELYAAEEDDRLPNCNAAEELLTELGNNCDVIIAVVSREYIETLPAHLLRKEIQTSLNRGDCLIIDFGREEVSYLRG